MTNPQTACLDPYLKQKVTREADIPDGLEACDKVPQPRQLWLQTGALTSLPSAAGGRTRPVWEARGGEGGGAGRLAGTEEMCS